MVVYIKGLWNRVGQVETRDKILVCAANNLVSGEYSC